MYVTPILITPIDDFEPDVLHLAVTDPEPLAAELKRIASEQGLSIDLLVERARDTDRAGYAGSSLREMLHGKRTLQLRAMVAFSKALDVDLTGNAEYRLRLVRYLLDETIHSPKVALANLESLEIGYLPQLSDAQVQAIPISHRKIPGSAAEKAKQTTSRMRGR